MKGERIRLKLISWNVNGLRACLGKGFSEFFWKEDADIFCLQETKAQEGQVEFETPGYFSYWNSAQRKGYSGTAVFAKKEPIAVSYGIGNHEFDSEGRVITLEYENFFLCTVYTPNSQRGLVRIDFRKAFEDAFREYLLQLEEKKPVVICGDMNVARSPIELKNPASNEGNAGYSEPERQKMQELLESGFIDSYRYFYPDRTGMYTWWSYMYNSRLNNAGWRIDYFLVSKKLRYAMRDALIYSDVEGSDHCPVGLMIDL